MNQRYRHQPIVRAASRTTRHKRDDFVMIDDKEYDMNGTREFYGSLYIGSNQEYLDVLYDTTSDWTVVYDGYTDSATFKGMWRPNGSPIYKTVSVSIMPHLKFERPVYSESMCLRKDEGTAARLCVKDFPFIQIPIFEKQTYYRGVIGLARGHPKSPTYVQLMKQQGVIENAIIGMSYQDPENKDKISEVSFGYIDYTKIEGGVNGTIQYKNKGGYQWALEIDGFDYNGETMTTASANQSTKAFIDSGNTTIQVPSKVWHKLQPLVDKDAYGHYFKVPDAKATFGNPLVYNRTCSNLRNFLRPITLKLGSVDLVLESSGYTYQPTSDKNFCAIGITYSPKENFYRLGMAFLSNFYTALDYDQDQITIGVNAAAADWVRASMVKHQPKDQPDVKPDEENPEKQKPASEDSKDQQTQNQDQDQSKKEPKDDHPSQKSEKKKQQPAKKRTLFQRFEDGLRALFNEFEDGLRAMFNVFEDSLRACLNVLLSPFRFLEHLSLPKVNSNLILSAAKKK